MRKRAQLAYFVLALFLFGVVNLPDRTTGGLRRLFLHAADLFAAFASSEEQGEILQLQVENTALKEEIAEVKRWLLSEQRIEEYVEKIQGLLRDKGHIPFYQRRLTDLHALLANEVYSVHAEVIFRDPKLWSSGFWVNKGESSNRRLGKKIICKNSPVVLGSALVGIVEEVEDHRSYVRLLTDSSLTPAVRAIRGFEQNEALAKEIESFEEQLRLREDLQIPEGLFIQLSTLKEELLSDSETRYLAKGELCGSSALLWRCPGTTLKGRGFNYDFADREGPARSLHGKGEKALLRVGDLLVTSGLDGLFPAGLKVALVSKITPLKEGGYAYDLEAKSFISDLNSLSSVQICPPVVNTVF
jgi:rod shape-determining protein MreC